MIHVQGLEQCLAFSKKATDPTADEKPGSRKQLRSLDRPHPHCAHSSASPWGPRWNACFLSRRQTHRLLPSSGKCPCNRVTGRGAGHCPPLTPSYEPPSSDLTSQSFRLPSRCPAEPRPVWENCQEGSAQRRASIMLNNGLITLLACLAGAPGVSCTCGHSR